MTVPEITREAFADLRKKKPRRIQVAESLHAPCARYSNGVLKFSFRQTALPIFEKETGIDMLPDNFDDNARWLPVQTAEVREKINEWIVRHGDTVFIRSLLPQCIALDFQMQTRNGKITDNRTRTGKLVYQAKPKHEQSEWTQGNRDAAAELAGFLAAKIRDTAFYKDAAYIAAVPPAPGKPLDLPSLLVAQIAKICDLRDIGACFSYSSEKSMLKGVKISDKWAELEKSGMVFDTEKCSKIDATKGVILLDDLYQSGATMHYAAMQMQGAGLSDICGLAAVKTMRNDDNQPRDD